MEIKIIFIFWLLVSIILILEIKVSLMIKTYNFYYLRYYNIVFIYCFLGFFVKGNGFLAIISI
jgi:hypothetical protein